VRGFFFANGTGLQSIIAESDFMETIEACTGEEAWWNLLHFLLIVLISWRRLERLPLNVARGKQIKGLMRLLVLVIVIKPLVIGSMKPLVFLLANS
jgi:hypothetical protein